MRKDLFEPSAEGEARLLLLINAFSGGAHCLEGRTKLAKLDFLLRYPSYLQRALEIRTGGIPADALGAGTPDIETRMVRYRYGPWDPAYYALLGRLIGRGLVSPTPFPKGIGYRATLDGAALASRLSETEEWGQVATATRLLRRHFDLQGTRLKRFIYDNFPEVVARDWGQPI